MAKKYRKRVAGRAEVQAQLHAVSSGVARGLVPTAEDLRGPPSKAALVVEPALLIVPSVVLDDGIETEPAVPPPSPPPPRRALLAAEQGAIDKRRAAGRPVRTDGKKQISGR